MVRGPLVREPPPPPPFPKHHATVRIRVVADMSGHPYCRELTVCFPRASGQAEGPLAANRYPRPHQRRGIMRVGPLFKITDGGLSVCMHVALVCLCYIVRVQYVYVCICACLYVHVCACVLCLSLWATGQTPTSSYPD